MNNFVSVIKKVSPITWKVGILLIVILTISETIFAITSFDKESKYQDLIKNMRIILFVPSNISKDGILNTIQEQLGDTKIIKPQDAAKLLPNILKNGIDKSYIQKLPTVIIITNSSKLFSIKTIDKLKRLRPSGISMSFNEDKMNTLFHNYRTFHMHFIITVFIVMVVAILLYYIVRLIFRNESQALAAFIWHIGVDRKFLSGMGNLFFLLITLIATFLSAAALMLSFFLKLLGAVDITAATLSFVVILTVNMMLSVVMATGCWKVK